MYAYRYMTIYTDTYITHRLEIERRIFNISWRPSRRTHIHIIKSNRYTCEIQIVFLIATRRGSHAKWRCWRTRLICIAANTFSGNNKNIFALPVRRNVVAQPSCNSACRGLNICRGPASRTREMYKILRRHNEPLTPTAVLFRRARRPVNFSRDILFPISRYWTTSTRSGIGTGAAGRHARAHTRTHFRKCKRGAIQYEYYTIFRYRTQCLSGKMWN